MVRTNLDSLGIKFKNIDLGIIETQDELSQKQQELLRKTLMVSGLELMDDKRSIIIEKIKLLVLQMIHNSQELPAINYSDHISNAIGYNYAYLATIFSEVKGYTIQQFIILHKIERVKELILYDELSLTEISRKLQYSSVAHLSNQFKKITGLSPSVYKHLREKRKQNLENL